MRLDRRNDRDPRRDRRGDRFELEDGTIGLDVVTEQVVPDRRALLAGLAMYE
jgi:hypothetical protein